MSDEWHTFENFLADMGEPSPGMVLDRKRNALGYSKDNARWATFRDSTENRRNTVWVNWDGRRWRVAELATHFKVLPSLIYQRLMRGVSFGDLANP